MRLLLAITLVLTVNAHSQSTPAPQAKFAQEAFKHAQKLLEHKQYQAALDELQRATKLDGQNAEYFAALDTVRQIIIQQHLEKGNAAVQHNDAVAAMAEFGAALALDPRNELARQQLNAMSVAADPKPSRLLEETARSTEVRLNPALTPRSFHFQGDSRALLAQIAAGFGITAIFDVDFTPRAVTFEAEYASFQTAISTSTSLAHALWVPMTTDQIFIAQDTQENRRQFERSLLRTFYVSDVSTPQEMNEMVSLLRGIFNIRYVVPNFAKGLIVVRAPGPMMDAAAEFMQNLGSRRPEVMIDVQAYEISHTFLRNLGINLPLQFELINLGSAALALLNQPNIQQQITQILAQGLTPQNQAALQALLAQLQNQQNSPISQLLNTPFATFGGGSTLFAVTIPSATANFQFNQSTFTNLEHATLRAEQGETATFRVGTRFPVITASFSANPGSISLNGFNAPGASTPATAAGTQVAFPSFTYEDLGVTLKAKPQIHVHRVPAVERIGANSTVISQTENSEVTLDLELAIRSLGAASFNGIPVISNREYKGTIRLKDGEPALVVGAVSHDQERSFSGIPGLGNLPFVRRAFSTENKNITDDEILVIVTPYIVRSPDRTGSVEQWVNSIE